MKLKATLLALVASTFVGCGSSPTGPDDVAAIRVATSFGFCLGYCQATLEITPQGLVYLEEDLRGGLPPRRQSATLSAAEWQSLVEAVDRSRMESLPERIGCPDCADGGAEWLEVVATDWQRRITFEARASIPELQPLLERARALRSRFTS
jgi:hypothetical protein